MIAPPLQQRKVVFILLVIAILVLLFFGFISSNVGSVGTLSSEDKRTLDAAGAALTYDISVETRLILPDRVIHILGSYSGNRKTQSYAAVSTTTLHLKDIPTPHIFVLKNVALGDTIFTSLESASTLIKKTMPATNGWKQLTSKTIPKEFENIAIAGPVSDNLLILSESGKYLTLRANMTLRNATEKSFAHYRFSIADVPPPAGVLETLFRRIGKEGYVDIWIDRTRPEQFVMLFSNQHYNSTTTVNAINKPVVIQAPRI